VELKAIDPPPSIQDSMEKQMRADREKRAMILTAEGQREASIKTAEGQKQSQILAAEGSKQATIMAAEAERQSRILRAQGERAARYLQSQGQAKAIEKVFAAIKAGKPTPEVLAYQYLQTLPQMAQGDANKVWMIPSDYGKALEGFARAFGAPGDDGVFRYEPSKEEDVQAPSLEDDDVASWFDVSTDPRVAEAVRAAEAVARKEVDGPLGISTPARSVGVSAKTDHEPSAEPDDAERGTQKFDLPKRQPATQTPPSQPAPPSAPGPQRTPPPNPPGGATPFNGPQGDAPRQF
jgi:hypothetical protein